MEKALKLMPMYLSGWVHDKNPQKQHNGQMIISIMPATIMSTKRSHTGRRTGDIPPSLVIKIAVIAERRILDQESTYNLTR